MQLKCKPAPDRCPPWGCPREPREIKGKNKAWIFQSVTEHRESLSEVGKAPESLGPTSQGKKKSQRFLTCHFRNQWKPTFSACWETCSLARWVSKKSLFLFCIGSLCWLGQLVTNIIMASGSLPGRPHGQPHRCRAGQQPGKIWLLADTSWARVLSFLKLSIRSMFPL